MKRRIGSIVLAVLGVLAIVAGILAGTTFKDKDRVTASPASAPSTPVVIVPPGVLPLVNDDVEVTAEGADGAPVFLALAPLPDVEAWVDGAAATEITGLKDWETLAVSDRDGQDEAVPDPSSADLFDETRTAEGRVTWKVTDPDHQLALIAVTDGENPAPTLTLSWSRETSAPAMIPLIVAGAVLLLAAAALLLAGRSARPRRVRPNDAETEVIHVPALAAAETEGLTRREIRDLERTREREAADTAKRSGKRNFQVITTYDMPAIDEPILDQSIERLTSTGMAAGTMIVPAAPNAEEIRAQVPDAERFGPAAGSVPQDPPEVPDPGQSEPADTDAAEPDAAAPVAGRGALIVPPARLWPEAEAEDEKAAEPLWPDTSAEPAAESAEDWRDHWDFPDTEQGADK